uniref:TIL domain-containing protein n=1 Tax=Oreochromis niloticus TaxID=8128 RepID=A0A669DBE7_ORENI
YILLTNIIIELIIIFIIVYGGEVKIQSLTCPPNSSYSLCVSSCPETCLGVVGPPGCEEVCVEGCECNPGFILINGILNPWFASKCIFII